MGAGRESRGILIFEPLHGEFGARAPPRSPFVTPIALVKFVPRETNTKDALIIRGLCGAFPCLCGI